MNVSFTCSCVLLVPMEVKKLLEPLELENDGCDLPYMYWKLNLGLYKNKCS